MVAANSRCTKPTKAWPGVSEPTTSWPRALSLTRAMNSRTTGSATSASSKAMRTSRNMSATLDSVMRAWPLRCLTSLESLSVSAVAMGIRCKAVGWRAQGPERKAQRRLWAKR